MREGRQETGVETETGDRRQEEQAKINVMTLGLIACKQLMQTIAMEQQADSSYRWWTGWDRSGKLLKLGYQ